MQQQFIAHMIGQGGGCESSHGIKSHNDETWAEQHRRYPLAWELARASSRRVAYTSHPHPRYLLSQPPGVLGTTANSLYWDIMLVYSTLCWTSRGTQRDWPVSRRLRSVHDRSHTCLGRAVFGG